MFTTLGATFLTTGATLVAALRSRLIGVSWMVSLGAELVLATAGAPPAGPAIWRAMKRIRLPRAAKRLVRENPNIMFMSFTSSTILYYGHRADRPPQNPW